MRDCRLAASFRPHGLATFLVIVACPVGSMAAHFFGASGPIPKFVNARGILRYELRKQRGTSNSMILVPLFDLKFLSEFAAGGVGTSTPRQS